MANRLKYILMNIFYNKDMCKIIVFISEEFLKLPLKSVNYRIFEGILIMYPSFLEILCGPYSYKIYTY